MVFLRRTSFFTLFFIFCIAIAKGQKKPIGSWQSYLPYNSVLGVATDGNTLFAAGAQAFFTYETKNNGQTETYSKVEGMSDIGMQAIGYDMATSTTVLVYTNGNIDLFKDNTFYNIPELKLKNIAGVKTVYDVYTVNGYAYLSSAIGVLVINLSDHTIKETYQFIANNQTIAVKGFIAFGNYFYVATTNGVYRATQDNPQLQNFLAWDLVDGNKTYTAIKSVGDKLFVATDKSVFTLDPTGTHTYYTSHVSLHHIDAGLTNLIISEYADSFYRGSIKLTDPADAHITDSFTCICYPFQTIQLLDSSLWVADRFGGLMKRLTGNNVSYYTPAGPLDPSVFDMYVHNNDLWIAHGGYNASIVLSGDHNGIAHFSGDKWTYYADGIYPPFNGLQDFITITKDEQNGTVYTGSFNNGLFILNKDGSHQLVNNGSIFDPSSYFSFGDGRQVGGIAIDGNHNVWISTMGSAHQLYVKTADSQWYSFLIPNSTSGGQALVDDNDQVWFICTGISGGFLGGLSVLNYNGTVNDPTDDATYHFSTGAGSGNLASNDVKCITKDKNNNIWVGTGDGICIINGCHPSTTAASSCDAEIPIVQYDNYAGFLFKGNTVRTIAVDGANRKWIGTDDGVWLLSSDAGKIIYNFNVDNSPLPSNHIQKIAVDPVTGVVYIGTEQGLITFRGTATDGGTSNSNVITFPSPVPSGYTGTIAIKGLVANGDVRITDINGQLVYKTKALGGQAVWNGLDYTGRRPQSGVYLIFVSSSDGAETYTGKMVFLK